MNRLPNLTDDELHGTLLNALRVAEEEYQKLSLAAAPLGLAEQFLTQSRKCVRLLDKLEEQSTGE